MRNAHIVCPSYAPVGEALRYNQLKTVILDLLTTEGWCDSNRIIERAQSESGLSGSTRAVRMALLRYHRHGLLHREWRRGEYVYRLSNRGARRLVWLKGLATDQSTNAGASTIRSGFDGANPSE